MSGIRFEWDPRKAAANVAKHGISFEEASTAFADELALLIADPEHSQEEDRFVLLGLSVARRLVVVVHCDRGETASSELIIRIISARRATPGERRQYQSRNQP